MRILAIEPDRNTQNTLIETLIDHEVLVATTAQKAITYANENDFDRVVLELSLGGHSGMEFIYEFRSYPDWRGIPIIVYSTVLVDGKIQSSRGWRQLNIKGCLYKPKTSLRILRETVVE